MEEREDEKERIAGVLRLARGRRQPAGVWQWERKTGKVDSRAGYTEPECARYPAVHLNISPGRGGGS